MAPIGGRVRIAVAFWSYCDCLYFGITGDRDTAPDIERLGHGIAREFAGILEAAQSGRPLRVGILASRVSKGSPGLSDQAGDARPLGPGPAPLA